jgi:hypothetical protein
MTDYRAPETFEDAVYALKRTRAKNDELLRELAKVKRERNEARDKMSAMTIRRADSARVSEEPTPPDIHPTDTRAEPGKPLKGIMRRLGWIKTEGKGI